MKEIINNTIKKFLFEAKQHNKIISIGKNNIDKIRAQHPDLNSILNEKVFDNPNIYLKGGVARLAFEIYLNTGVYKKIRDIDLCYIGDYKVFIRTIDDYKIDYEGKTVEDYFQSRDITLNEVLLRPDELLFTRRAYRDYQNKIINARRIKVGSRLLSRMLLFAVRYGYEINENVKSDEINDFDFLVCLLKAYELNIETEYFNICKIYGVTKTSNLSEWLLELLEENIYFNLGDRIDLVAKDISKIENYNKKLKIIYNHFPKLKDEVSKLEFDFNDYSRFFSKPNRHKKYSF